MPSFIDTHCHVQDRQYDADRDEVIRRSFQSGVSMICVGTDFEMSRKAIALAEQHEGPPSPDGSGRAGIWASVGLHPNDNLEEKYDNARYVHLAEHAKVVAIGEIGLDYYRTTDETKKKFQKERFIQQLDLAAQVNKPVIIHCRDAHKDMIDILKTQINIAGVIHSFTGTLQEAERYVALGFYIGLNGIITFARQYDDVVRGVPLENILLETDAPYLTPVPHRGQRNEPAYVARVAEQVAQLRGISVQEVEMATSENARKLFHL